MGYKQFVADMCLCRKQDGEDFVVVGVYADDLGAIGTSTSAVDRLFVSLGSLSTKDSGLMSNFGACAC